jgi:hypothetical protein
LETEVGSSAPDWSGRAPSWSKLSDIEDWLRGPGPAEQPELVPEAGLQLAEGRLALARKEGPSLPPQVLALRLSAAESGFRDVLTTKGVKPSQKLRAERGLEELRGLRPGGVAPTTRAPAALAVQPRSSWGASAANPSRLDPGGRWSRITIHHTAKYSSEIGSPTARNVAETIHDIQLFHMRERGWGDIGYHFLIDPAGRIWQGRSLDWQGAHAGGDNNVGNIGVCLIGDFDHERPDPRALSALEELVDMLCERHQIRRSRVYGHNKFAPTECPGDGLMAWVARYASGATH